MKLKDRQFWNGRKRKYYPSFVMALKDAVKFASFWTCFMFCSSAIMSFLTNGTLSWNIVLSGFLLLACTFLLGVGMFLRENYSKQQRTIKSAISLLPEDCQVTCIEFNEADRQYHILTTYNHKHFAVKVEYPNLWISEKDSRNSLGFLKMTSKKYDDNKKLIYKFMNYEPR